MNQSVINQLREKHIINPILSPKQIYPQNVVPLQAFKHQNMDKKSSFNPRDKKSSGSFDKKEGSRGGSSYSKKPFKRDGAGDDTRSDRPRKDYGGPSGREGGFKKKESYGKPAGRSEGTDRPRKSNFTEGDRPARPSYGAKSTEGGSPDRKPYNTERRSNTGRDSKRPFSDRGERPDSRPDRSSDKPFSREPRTDRAPGRPYGAGAGSDSRPPRRENSDRPYGKSEGGERKPYSRPRTEGDASGEGASKRPYQDRSERGSDGGGARKEFRKPFNKDEKRGGPEKKPYAYGKDKPMPGPRKESPADFYKKKERPYTEAENRYLEDDGEEWEVVEEKRRKKKPPVAANFPMPLNKYIAHSGECSRRDAAELVHQGKAKVNGELIVDPGHKINETDKVTLSGKKLALQTGMVYILLNKPKGFITTNDDPQGRRTVMELVASADVGRLYPVGRLDRATTGLILMTNDGALAQKLSHPSGKVKKVYHVTLDKPLTQTDFDKIMEGIELEDGKSIIDEMAYLESKNEIGLEIHSGKNRIVRRTFESLGYVVEKLDRVMYAGLTKKNLPRSKWRFLDEREIILLKHFKS